MKEKESEKARGEKEERMRKKETNKPNITKKGKRIERNKQTNK